MKRYTLLVLFTLFLHGFSTAQTQPANPNATQRTRCLLQYFESLRNSSGNRVISGQMINVALSPSVGFDSAITKIYNRTGKWVGILGADYQRVNTGVPNNMRDTNLKLIEYARSGGLVAIMCSFSNPWNNGTSNDTTGTGHYNDLITTGTTANTRFLWRLDSVATGFKHLQDSGVTALWRPFHEMNGTWFWWGSKNPPNIPPTPAEFVAVWQYMFNYLTYAKQVNNILWVYSPSARESNVNNPNFKTEMHYYPGSAYVDIVGVDVYNDTLDIPNYPSLVASQKPLAIAEFGPKRTPSGLPAFTYDYTRLINEIRTKYPAFVYWMSWNDFVTMGGTVFVYYAIGNQNNATELLLDPWVVTREELNPTVGCVPSPLTSSISVRPGWNLLSLPVDHPGIAPNAAFPTASSPAFSFGAGGYIQSDTLFSGRGYFMKFPAADTASITGTYRWMDTLALRAGWNLIGAMSAPIRTASILQIPPGIVSSPYFRFDGSYNAVDTLVPGRGHWIKSTQNGSLIFISE